ncbi:MAG: hypothetical protein ACXIVQ_03325 [Acidimicrobiales bacterium]
MEGAAFLGVLGAAAGAWFLTTRARRGHMSHQVLTYLAAACIAALAIITLSDWPAEWLNEFWSEHSILAGLVSTLLLVGAGLLGIESRHLEEEEKLSEAMAGTAFAGLVDPLLDIDLALAFLAQPSENMPSDWSSPGKPLRWVRDLRSSEAALSRWTADPDALFQAADSRIAGAVLDACIRRTVGSARDWAALAAGSSDGRAVLAEFGSIRNELTRLEASIRRGDTVAEIWAHLRADLQQTALALEVAAGSPTLRPVLQSLPTADVRAVLPERAEEIERMKMRFDMEGAGRLGAIRSQLPATNRGR